MNVTVTRQDVEQARNEGSVLVVTGTDTESRDFVSFGADYRAAEELLWAAYENGSAEAYVEPWQVLSRVPCRRAVLKADSEQEACKLAKTVKAYLPANYSVVGCHGGVVTVEGHDYAGWTLDDYVLPRLASGLLHAEEVRCSPVNDLGGQDASPRFGADEHLTW